MQEGHFIHNFNEKNIFSGLKIGVMYMMASLREYD